MKYVRLGAAALLLCAFLVAWEAKPVSAQEAVKLKLLLPYDPARVTVDGKVSKGSGDERQVAVTPKGKTITIEVFWEPNNYTKITRTRKLNVADIKGIATVDLREASKEMPDDIVVRYVPTPDDIVARMCKMANVGKNDIVYDLGCGDGRMVIMAVEKFGAKRGVGVDIDPKLVAECKENAKLHKVADKVEFREGDVLKIDDLKDATVVLLYMGDDINNRLKPILQKTLQPGSRVVSHRFLMGEWEPTKSETVRGEDGDEYDLHLWIIGDNKKKKK